jgi:hypothetical protein
MTKQVSFAAAAALSTIVLFSASKSWGLEHCGPPPTWTLQQFELSLTRDECFGECPSYSLTVTGDGRIAYVGRSYVSVVGERSGQLDEPAIRELIEKVYKSRFFDCAGEYNVEFGNDGRVVAYRKPRTLPVDAPSVSLRITIGDFQKQEWYAPTDRDKVFWELARSIDELVDTRRWVEGR